MGKFFTKEYLDSFIGKKHNKLAEDFIKSMKILKLVKDYITLGIE